MDNFKKILIIIVLFAGPMASAYTPGEGKITAMAGPFVYQPNFEANVPGIESRPSGSIALIAEGDLGNRGGLEIGMFYLDKLYFRKQSGLAIAEKLKIMYITMGYRHWFSSKFSGGLALFSSYSMGDPQIVANQFAPGQVPRTSARDTTDYGFDFSLQWEIWSNEKFGVVLDTRYSFSVTEKEKEDSDHYGALIGIRYLIQEK